MKDYFPDQEILICRELTKIHESFYRGNLSKINNFDFIPKGEVTVLISEIKNKKNCRYRQSDKKKFKN